MSDRAPRDLWRRVVYGLSPIEVVVEPSPEDHHGPGVGWFGSRGAAATWAWEVPDGHPMRVHAFTRGDRVDLWLGEELIATRTRAEGLDGEAIFAVPHREGELTAVAFRDDAEIGRCALAASAPALPPAAPMAGLVFA